MFTLLHSLSIYSPYFGKDSSNILFYLYTYIEYFLTSHTQDWYHKCYLYAMSHHCKIQKKKKTTPDAVMSSQLKFRLWVHTLGLEHTQFFFHANLNLILSDRVHEQTLSLFRYNMNLKILGIDKIHYLSSRAFRDATCIIFIITWG